MAIRRCLSSCILVLLAAQRLQAEVPPGRWEKVAAVPPGTPICLRLESGERMEARFEQLRVDEIVVADESGRERRLPKSVVRRIESGASVPDRLNNGTWLGVFVGASVGLAAMMGFANAKTAGPVFWRDEGVGYLLGAALVGAGVGAATGALVDASSRGGEVLYRAR